MRAMLRLMLDTQEPTQGLSPDAELGPYMRLTDAAVARAKTKLGLDDRQATALSRALGLSTRMTLWRLRRGQYNIPVDKAMAIAEIIGWPLSRVFALPTTPAAPATTDKAA